MAFNLGTWLRTIGSATGFALAGPGGSLIGQLAGGLLATILPGQSAFVGDALGRFSGRMIELSGAAIGERLAPQERQRINHDLQAAFRDAFEQALIDLGGERCFPEAWERKPRDVPPGVSFSTLSQAEYLWRENDPLAGQVCDCLKGMQTALKAEKLLPFDPPTDQPAASVTEYLDSEDFQSLNNAFFAQVVSPQLASYTTLLAELPNFEPHLRKHLLERTLVHLGELLKHRTPAWRAYNRMLIETLRDELRQVDSGQTEILSRLDTLLDQDDPRPFHELTNRLTDLLSATGEIEKHIDEGFESLDARLISQHREALARFDQLLQASGRIETKVDRVLHILEDGRYVIEGSTSLAIDALPAPGEPPFKGLQFYQEADAGIFYGREMLTARLVDRIAEAISTTPSKDDAGGLHFLAIIGASGSGKSSVLRAGLIPAIKKGAPLADGTLPPPGYERWSVHLITPTAHPLQSLAASLAFNRTSKAVKALVNDMLKNPLSLDGFIQETLGAHNALEGNFVLLVIDQFEEIFTLCRSEVERQAFIDNLMAAARAGSSLILTIAMRADFYAHCGHFDNLRLALENYQAYIGPMTQVELRAAIEEPARRGGSDGVHWEFERGLVDLILRDAGDEPGALPLLSHALLETWKHRRGRTMTLESYAESGGVRGAIAKTAETVYYQRLTSTQQPIARKIFLSLTELGEGTRQGLPSPDTRRRAALEELMPDPAQQPEASAATQTVLRVLADARLVTMSEGSVEVAHEALIREWPTLRRWLDEDRAGLRLHRQLTEVAREWASLGQETAVLYRGSRLAQMIEWADAHPDQVSQQERDFLNASKTIADRQAAEKEAQRQRELDGARQLAQEAEARRQAEAERAQIAEKASAQLRSRNRIITAVGGVAVIAAALACISAFIAGFFGINSNRNADRAEQNLGTAQAANTQVVAEANTRATAEADARKQESTAVAASAEADLQRQIALVRELAARSTSLLGRDPDLGLLLAVESVKAAARLDKSQVPEAQTALYHALDTVKFQRVLRAGENDAWLVLFSPDGQSLLTTHEGGFANLWDLDGNSLATFEGESGKIVFASFSPDGKTIVTSSDDGLVRLWEPDGTLRKTLEGHQAVVYSALFSPDGSLIVTASADRTARLWHADGSLIKVLQGHTNEVTVANFSPDGKLIVTTSLDNTLRLWQADGTLVAELTGHTAWPISFSFSQDSSRLVSASWDGTARVWNMAGESLVVLEGHTRSLMSAVFSPDGEHILTASYDTTARIWDTEGNLITILEGHTGPLNLAIFSPDGNQILTASNDTTLRLWTAEGQLITALLGHSDFINWAIFRQDGKYIATASDDDSIRLWPVERLYNQVLQGHTTTVNDGRYSPDSETILTGSTDSTARLWTSEGIYISAIENQPSPVNAIDYSPDGQRVATGSFDKVAKIWRLDGTLLKTLEGHTELVSCVRFSPDGARLATASWDGTARLWRADGSLLKTFEGHTDVVNTIAFSPDGSLLVTASDDQTARIWEENGTLVAILQGDSTGFHSAVFSPDGSQVLTASYDGIARLWDLDGNVIAEFEGQTAQLTYADFSPNGAMIVTTSVDGTAWLWEADGPFIASLEGHRSWVNTGRFSPDGLRLVTTSWDGTARQWGVYGDAEAMLTEALSRLNRPLTEYECQEYLHLESCPSEP